MCRQRERITSGEGQKGDRLQGKVQREREGKAGRERTASHSRPGLPVGGRARGEITSLLPWRCRGVAFTGTEQQRRSYSHQVTTVIHPGELSVVLLPC